MSEKPDTETAADDEPRRRMKEALRAVRREGWKAALIHAVVDAAALFLVVNLLVVLVDPGWVPAGVSLPAAVTGPVGSALDMRLSDLAIPGSALLAGGLAAFAFVVGVWWRVRRSLVEQFEAVNPEVAEALRTARDAVADGEDSRMAARLYEDVLARLRESSGVALVDFRRVVVVVVLAIVVSLATVQVAVLDVELLAGGPAGPTDAGGDENRTYRGLQDPDEVLGDPEDVQAGDENLTAQVESTGGQEELDEDREQYPTDGAGGGSGGAVEGQQAGFASPDRVEDAELVREYNIRIRERTEEE